MVKFDHDELARLENLRSFNILDTSPEEDLDALTRLAAQLCDVPMCAISLTDAERQWFKSVLGLDVCENSREASFCTHAIKSDKPFLVKNARENQLFANYPMVIGFPNIAAYLGIPLISSEGYALGAFCVMDNKPRDFSKSQIAGLETIARQVMLHLETRRRKYQHQQQSIAFEKLTMMSEEQRELLEALAKGVSRREILISAMQLIEKQLSGNHCCILLLDKTRTQFEECISISLPQAYTQQFKGEKIAAKFGPCSTAASEQITVIVSNLLDEPRYAEFCRLTLVHQLVSCWSTPIFDSQQQVLGTFALYNKGPLAPATRKSPWLRPVLTW